MFTSVDRAIHLCLKACLDIGKLYEAPAAFGHIAIWLNNKGKASPASTNTHYPFQILKAHDQSQIEPKQSKGFLINLR